MVAGFHIASLYYTNILPYNWYSTLRRFDTLPQYSASVMLQQSLIPL
jgi:hypothetical protein